MASTKDYLDFVLDQLSDLEDIRFRQMMGGYIIYYKDKIIGGIYDDRFLVKPTKSVMEKIPDASYEVPYAGTKEMILVDAIDNREFLRDLILGMYEELPEQKRKKS